jgi:peptide chain release factor
MIQPRREVWLQLTAGQGPVECAWAVIKVAEKLREDAVSVGVETRTIELTPGPEAGTAHSALIVLSGGEALESFANAWRGTVQWIARSPFRPEHKRKNWFVGIEVLEPVEETRFDPKDVRWETMRASGPGGQHVNRTESAVRVTHLPTGIQAMAAEERSQHRNRKLALARLAKRIADRGEEQHSEAREMRWRVHQELERGNPVRVFRDGDK